MTGRELGLGAMSPRCLQICHPINNPQSCMIDGSMAATLTCRVGQEWQHLFNLISCLPIITLHEQAVNALHSHQRADEVSWQQLCQECHCWIQQFPILILRNFATEFSFISFPNYLQYTCIPFIGCFQKGVIWFLIFFLTDMTRIPSSQDRGTNANEGLQGEPDSPVSTNTTPATSPERPLSVCLLASYIFYVTRHTCT